MTSREDHTKLMISDYEVTFILKPSIEESETEASAQKVADVVTKLNGTVKNIEHMGRRRLAHEIADLREGIYVVITFSAAPTQIKELERQLTLNEDVLRHIVVRHEPKKHKSEAVAV